MTYLPKKLVSSIVGVLLVGGFLIGCSRTQPEIGPAAEVRVPLFSHGLPDGFFSVGTNTNVPGKSSGYRFVVWLNNERVVVGFNTSPNCRPSRDRTVDGMARILILDLQGKIQASRDNAYRFGAGEVTSFRVGERLGA